MSEPEQTFTITHEWLHQHKSANGGWTRRQMIAIGAEWPPRHRWQTGIIGAQISDTSRAIFESQRTVSPVEPTPEPLQATALCAWRDIATAPTSGKMWVTWGDADAVIAALVAERDAAHAVGYTRAKEDCADENGRLNTLRYQAEAERDAAQQEIVRLKEDRALNAKFYAATIDQRNKAWADNKTLTNALRAFTE